MRPDDLSRFVTISDPHLHPDGVQVAFVVSRPDLEKDRYHRRIWLWDGAEARAFTHGPADSRPRWSPDGTRLAFLRATGEEGKPAQVAVMSAGGGEAVVITSFALGATEAEWSPDGARLAVVGVEWAGEWAGLDDDGRKRQPRRITRAGYRFDDLGWRHDRRSNVYLVDPAGGDASALSGGEYHDSALAWRPDGAAVGFLSPRHDQRGIDGATQAWEVPTAGGDLRALVSPGSWHVLSYRSDGVVFLVGHPDSWDYPTPAGLWRLEGDRVVPIAAHLDRSFAPPSPQVFPAGPQWLADGSCFCVIEDRGRQRVIRVAPDGAVADVGGGDRVVTGLTSRPDGSAFTFTATTPTDPGELWWGEGGEERCLTSLNADFRAEAGLVAAEPFTVLSDGVEIDAWAYLPPGEEKASLLLNIHGGPATQFGWGFFDEFQVYVGAGYGVIACNPRGSSGRGRDFVRVPVGRWVEERPPDLEDILAVAAAALERFPRLDPERQGIMGGSYGGYMTACIISVDGRFHSAVPERGLYSYTSFSGTSDIGLRFPRMYLGDREYGQWERLWAASPLARIDRVTTPCLIVHSEGDARCPIEQGEQWFAGLIANGVEAEMLRFPGASHELSRSGKPRWRKERFEAILEWHARHLGPADVTT
ncbi:MAG: S9 family peptidase [Acidimicrobiia bacterium]|nr:S9 family peptidase [Acidimicrobiia bacterium]